MNSNFKTYMITGGAGFIGSHLFDRLVELGHKIIIVDDLSSGHKSNISENTNNEFLIEKIQEISFNNINTVDGIFHLAAQASVPYSIENFYESSKNNLLSSLKIFSWANDNNIPIVYASSSAVYGNLDLGDDKINKFDILSPYAQDKLTLENYAKMSWKIYKTPSIGLRFFNVYGPRQDPSNPYSGVISIFIDRLLNNKSVTVNGGYQTRDFIFVKDITEIMIKSMGLLSNKKSCEVLNVGSGISVSINSLLDKIANILEVEPKIVLKELPFGDPEKSFGNYEKLMEIIGYDINQFIELKDGLLETINFEKMGRNK